MLHHLLRFLIIFEGKHISQFGDLIASLIKRHYGIKDYGKLFPGHGGVMDRFDSIIAISPFLLMICSYPNIYAIFS